MKTGFGQLNRASLAEDSDVENDKQDKAHAEASQTPPPEDLPEYDTATLFAGRREIIIHHAGAAYRMKITKQGKLILNK
jgi:hemin uptake protein HemP